MGFRVVWGLLDRGLRGPHSRSDPGRARGRVFLLARLSPRFCQWPRVSAHNPRAIELLTAVRGIVRLKGFGLNQPHCGPCALASPRAVNPRFRDIGLFGGILSTSKLPPMIEKSVIDALVGNTSRKFERRAKALGGGMPCGLVRMAE